MPFSDQKYLGKKVLCNCHEYLLKTLEPKDLQDYIIEKRALTESEREIVFAEVTREGRVNEFIRVIKFKDDGYIKLKQMLYRMDWILKKLEDEERNLQQNGEHIHIMNRLSEAQKTQKLEEIHLVQLADHIGMRWKELAGRLNVPRSQMENIEYSREPATRMAFNALLSWKRNSPSDSVNISYLYRAMDAAGIELSDSDILDLFKD